MYCPSSGATLALLLTLSALPARAAGPDAVQAVTGARGYVLYNATREGESASVVRPNGRTPIRVRPGTRFNAIAELSDGFIVAGTRQTGVGQELLIIKGVDAIAAVQPIPGSAAGPLRDEPVPLVSGGKLVGLVWLEGDGPKTFRVMAADWEQTQWGMPFELAPRGTGSQLALSAAVLEDGSWLVAWSGHDGTDDEIWWTRVQGGHPSKPVRAGDDNEVPDVTPTLVPAGKGALLAWSRYDGNDYRLALASFAEGKFRAVEVGSGAGAVEPRFVAVAGAPVLLYRSVAPEAWTLLKLDPRGKPVRSAQVDGRGGARPAVRPEADGVALHFEGLAEGEGLTKSPWKALR